MKKILLYIAFALNVSASTLTPAGNNGSSGITFNGVGQSVGQVAKGDFWFNSRWSNASPLLTNQVPLNYINVYAPDFVFNTWVWNLYYGGSPDRRSNVSDQIYMAWTYYNDYDLKLWTPTGAPVVGNGVYNDVNDPSVVNNNGAWSMLYTTHTVADDHPSTYPGIHFGWINYSTSNDGFNWTPNAGTTSSRLNPILDPSNILGGELASIGRPCLIRKNGQWWLYFDYLLWANKATSTLAPGFHTGLATSSSSSATVNGSTVFTAAKKFPIDSQGFPLLLEASMWTDNGGTMHALFRKNQWEIWTVDSADGLTWGTPQPVAKASYHPQANYGGSGARFSNPGAIYQPSTGTFHGMMVGVLDPAPAPAETAKLHLFLDQYKVFAWTANGTVIAGNGYATARGVFFLDLSGATTYSRIMVTNPVLGTVLIDQNVSGVAGDIYNFSP